MSAILTSSVTLTPSILRRLAVATYEVAVGPLDQSEDVSGVWELALADCLGAMFEGTPELAGIDWQSFAREYLAED